MPFVRIPRQHTVNRVAQQSLDALRWLGESCIVLRMYHSPIDEDTQPRCPNCWNPAYTQADSSKDCPECYGTSFLGGVKVAYKTFGIFTDNEEGEEYRPRGEFRPSNRRVQLPFIAELTQHDIVVRISHWTDPFSTQGTATVDSYYWVGSTLPASLRDGARIGQTSSDVWASLTTLEQMHPNHPIRFWQPTQMVDLLRDNSIIMPTFDSTKLEHPLMTPREQLQREATERVPI